MTVNALDKILAPSPPGPRRRLPTILAVLLGVGLVIGLPIYVWDQMWGPSRASKGRLAELRREPLLRGAPGWTRVSYSENGDSKLAAGSDQTYIKVVWDTGLQYSDTNRVRVRRTLTQLYASDYTVSSTNLYATEVVNRKTERSVAFYLDGSGTRLYVEMFTRAEGPAT